MSFSTRPVSPGVARLRASRARRRRHAVLLALSMLAATVLLGVISFNAGTTLTLTVLLPVFLVLLAVVLVVNTRLSMATGATLGYRRLDERQRAELDRATRTGHRVTSMLLMVAFFVAAVLAGPTPESVSFPEELFMPVLWVIFMAHASIPTLYLAWTQPDELPDDEDA